MTLVAVLKEQAVTKGDINGDGEVDNKDVVLLFRFLSGGSDEGLIKKLMDFNGDGFVNNKDVATLFRYISGSME